MKRFLCATSFLALIGMCPLNADAQNVDLTLDTAKTGAPISKYIYGQFIEHLGRSIYGGLWAEMIEDRKFCHPVSDNFDPLDTATDPMWNTGPYQFLKASPWKVIGPAGTVTMDKDKPYVGEQSAVVHLPGDGKEAGIEQGSKTAGPLAISVEQGKKYVGRIVLAGEAGVGAVTVELVLNDTRRIGVRANMDDLTDQFKSYPIEFEPKASSDTVILRIYAKGKGAFKIGAASLMPADNVQGWRADTLAALKKLDTPILRWPGGNFVSGYNWRDGIDPNPDKRPPRKNPAWHNIEANDVGIHEYMALCGLLKTEPYIALNTGKGSVEECAAEVQYILGSADSENGKLRAANGRKEPWKVNFWAVGNEMYGKWQLGYMPLEDYEKKHNAAAKLIRAEDANGVLVACGDTSTAGWDLGMLTNCADNMNLLSLHTYVKEIKDDAVKHSAQLRDSIHGIAAAFRSYKDKVPNLASKNIKVAFDEWNFWYGDYLYGELGCQYHLKDGLGVAMGLHEFYRNSDIMQLACFAQTVNVLGAIKTSRTTASLEISGEVLAIYRHQYGKIPIVLMQPTPDLDVAAAWTDDKKAITVSIVNPTAKDREVTLHLGSVSAKSAATQFEIKGTDPQQFNEPGRDPAVQAVQKTLDFSGKLSAPAYSAELYRLEIK